MLSTGRNYVATAWWVATLPGICLFVLVLAVNLTGDAVRDRLKFLCATPDGFAVAQYDLEHRGPGDFFGSRQHGLPDLQIADLMGDSRTLNAAQSEAIALLAADPALSAPEHRLLSLSVQRMFERAGALN